MRRSNTTVGKIDTHSQAQAQRRPLSDNRSANLPVSPSFFQAALFSTRPANSNTKTDDVHVCRDCKEVAERDEMCQQQQQQQQQQSMFSDEEEEEEQSDDEMSQHVFEQQQQQQQDHLDRRERRLRLTKSLIFE